MTTARNVFATAVDDDLAGAIQRHVVRLRQDARWARVTKSNALADLIARGVQAVEGDDNRVS